MNENRPDIIPATKIGHLLEAYPDLEPLLIELSPAFEKLKNPILRKTVAKITTLTQAAKIGKIPIEQLINALREAAGLAPIEVELSEEVISPNPPEWFKTINITKSLDSRPLLDSGSFPLTIVLEDLKKIGSGEGFELIAPFLPSPLIDKVRKKGYSCWAKEDAENNLFRVFFTKS